MFLTAFLTFDSSNGMMGGRVVGMGVCWLGGCVGMGILMKDNPSDLAKKNYENSWYKGNKYLYYFRVKADFR